MSPKNSEQLEITRSVRKYQGDEPDHEFRKLCSDPGEYS